jgi:hypothetical protein
MLARSYCGYIIVIDSIMMKAGAHFMAKNNLIISLRHIKSFFTLASLAIQLAGINPVKWKRGWNNLRLSRIPSMSD